MLKSGRDFPLAALWTLASSSSSNYFPFALISFKHPCPGLRNGEEFVLDLSSLKAALLQ